MAGAAVLLAGVCLPGGAAAAGWTSVPADQLDPLQRRRVRGGDPRGGRLSSCRRRGSTWPTLPVVVNFAHAVAAVRVRRRCTADTLPADRRRKLVALDSAVAHRRGSSGGRRPVAAFDGQSCWFLALIIVGTSSTLGAVNYITTILKMRCPGMTLFRLPMTVWNLLHHQRAGPAVHAGAGSVLVMNLLDHHGLTSFFEPAGLGAEQRAVQAQRRRRVRAAGPAPVLVLQPPGGVHHDPAGVRHGQRHPADVFSRKPLFGYRPMVYATDAPSPFLGFLVWGHHMFQSGMNPALGTTFADQHDGDRRAERDQNVQLARHPVGRPAAPDRAHAQRLRVRQPVRHRRPERASSPLPPRSTRSCT